jgi:hypothetical protein
MVGPLERGRSQSFLPIALALPGELLDGDVADLEALLRHDFSDGPQRLARAAQPPHLLDGLLLIRVLDQLAARA